VRLNTSLPQHAWVHVSRQSTCCAVLVCVGVCLCHHASVAVSTRGSCSQPQCQHTTSRSDETLRQFITSYIYTHAMLCSQCFETSECQWKARRWSPLLPACPSAHKHHSPARASLRHTHPATHLRPQAQRHTHPQLPRLHAGLLLASNTAYVLCLDLLSFQVLTSPHPATQCGSCAA
jgi:hypothetical protein